MNCTKDVAYPLPKDVSYLFSTSRNISLEKIVKFYVDALAGPENAKFMSPKCNSGGPEFNETETFTATIDASASPTLTFTPQGGAFT